MIYAETAIFPERSSNSLEIWRGIAHALPRRMVVHRYRELIVWQLATEFRRETIRLIRASPEARRDFKFAGQLRSSARGISKHIAEGFLRFSPGEMKHYLDYGISSLGEAEEWLRDGIDSGYFTAADCQPAFRLGRRLLPGMIRLKQAQDRYLRSRDPKHSDRRRPRSSRKTSEP